MVNFRISGEVYKKIPPVQLVQSSRDEKGFGLGSVSIYISFCFVCMLRGGNFLVQCQLMF